jgi:opacity protein-like surface antigen
MLSRLLPAAALVALAAPALAGSLDAPVVVAAPATPLTLPVTPAAAPASDWSGFYLGGQISYGMLESDDLGVDGEGRLNGLHAGYQRDFGRFVLGGELEHDWGRIEIADADTGADTGGTIDRVLRAKLRVGYDAGRFLPYLTAGYAQADLSDAGDDQVEGMVYGVGTEIRLSDRFSTGVEFLHHEFDDVGGIDASASVNTIGLRGTFRF